ncbi:MAG: putative alternative RNA polymerase sigma factor SigM [Fimbriimonadales bacterium]
MELEVTCPPEAELIRRAARGDTGAFDELVDMHYRALFGLAYRMLGNSEDASDAVQETFVKAYRALPEFNTERALRPWLSKICANVAIDIGRARSRAPDPLEEHQHTLRDPAPPAEEQVLEQDRERAVHRAVANLPEKYRQIIVLRHFQHMDVEEIADLLNVPEGTVKSWLFRARAMLRRELAVLSPTPLPTEELAR